MEVYFLVAFILTLLCIGKSSKWKLAISFIFLLIIGGLRDVSVGTDTQNYAMLFDSYGSDVSMMYHATEPLFLLIQYVVASKGGGYEIMLFIIMAIILGTIHYYAYLVSKSYLYVILSFFLLYFYFYSFNTMRQYMGMGFCLIAFYYLSLQKVKRYILFVFIAFFFHATALVGFLAYFINKIKLNKKKQILLLAITFIVGLTPFVQQGMAFALHFLPDYLFQYILESEKTGAGFPFSRFLLTLYTIALVALLKEKSLNVKLLMVGICLLNLFDFQPIIGRIAQYFTIIQIAIIPNIRVLIKRKKNAKALKIASFIYMFVVWIYLLLNNVAEIVPYKMNPFFL